MILADNEKTRRRGAQVIAGGGLIAFRTDTFYGLGVDPFNPAAVARIKSLKAGDDNKPILLLIADPSDLDRVIVSKSAMFAAVARTFWPGPLTIVGAATIELPDEVTAGTGTVGVRLPDDKSVRALVRVCGGLLTATSANVSGSPPSRSAQDVARYFPAGVDLIIDGGEVTATEPSTVLDLSQAEPRLIREGAVGIARLRDCAIAEFQALGRD
jgi:L-threonylcarbamoyladenylate synthase